MIPAQSTSHISVDFSTNRSIASEAPDSNPPRDGLAPFESILFLDPRDHATDQPTEQPAYFHDLHLDQIVESVIAPWREFDLARHFYAPLRTAGEINYRQEIMRDLELPNVMASVRAFCDEMHSMRLCINHLPKCSYPYERERWFLDAVLTYCEALETLKRALDAASLKSNGMCRFRAYLKTYVASTGFAQVASQTKQLSGDLSAIQYSLVIHEGRITVSDYAGEIDYTEAVEKTFEKFRRGAVKSYLAQLFITPTMNHIQAQIVDRVARLNPEVFHALHEYYPANAHYLDATIAGFDRDVHFYIAYIDYISKVKLAGLRFCYPRISDASKEVFSRESFDLALAAKRAQEKLTVITNNFDLRGAERIFLVSGPNQGGKTTFARTFGQLHHLAALGCPVPGAEAGLFLFDQIFTHFEKEEDIADLRGKLHEDLVRIHAIVDRATSSSIVILNELFSSTTVKDALFLATRIMEKFSDLDVLGVWVSFLTELTTFNEKTVSMVSAVDPKDLTARTFKIERRSAEGITYAHALAEKHGVTYEAIKRRVKT